MRLRFCPDACGSSSGKNFLKNKVLNFSFSPHACQCLWLVRFSTSISSTIFNFISGEDFSSSTTLHKISIRQPGTLPPHEEKTKSPTKFLKVGLALQPCTHADQFLIAQLLINCYSPARDTAAHEEKIKLRTKFLTIGRLYHLEHTHPYYYYF